MMANFAVSEDGTLLYLPGRPPLSVPVWVDRQGGEEPLKMEPAQYGSFALSPDASKLAIGVRTSAIDVGLMVWDFAGETRTRLTLGDRGGSIPVWSPDGSRIIYDSQDGRISAKPANNTRPPEVVVERIQGKQDRIGPHAITADGRSILFSGTRSAVNSDIGMAPLDGKGEIKWLLNTKGFSELGPALSPDGKWMAYSSNESGRSEVYVSPFPRVDEDRVLISNTGGDRPVWSHDGKELFYVGGLTTQSRRFMSATVSAESGKLRVISRSPLWDGTNESLHFVTDYQTIVLRPIGPSHDGQRFLVLKEFNATADRAAERIQVVQNWTEELKRRVPVPAK
jgi:dipeptidyl aminopeptidase/acylaminoacyl peptidase